MLISNSNRSRWLGAALLGCTFLGLGLSATVAQASLPASTYTVASRVEFLPDEAKATQVVIHGAFFFYQNGGSYGTPSCGYMYFQCPVGSETMCRMQWQDIKNAIGQPQCMGFGAQSMTSKATLRATGTPIGNNPDTWDLGMGVSAGSSVGGQCPPAQALKCGMPASPDLAGPSDPTPDLATTVVPPPGPGPTSQVTGGCSFGGTPGALGGGLLVLGTAMAVLLRRRRR